jgi:hypothetical protein
MPTHTRAAIFAIRLAALFVMVALTSALCNFMLWLSWQVDCALAAAAAFAFAYKFERQESQ